MKKALKILGINTLIIICSTIAIILDALHFDLYIFIVAYAVLFWVVAFVEIIRLLIRNSNKKAINNKRFYNLFKNKSF